MLHQPERAWRLQGASNFRDLGGYAGMGGRALRWRRLFRSDHLANLTDVDRARLAALGPATAFDFRGGAERAATPYNLPGITQRSLAIEPSVVQRMQDLVDAGHSLTAPVVAGLMADLYRSLIRDQAHHFAALFNHLLQTDAPVVMHCTAGKDRTGVAAALILLALGVSRDQVLQDYLLTNALYQHPPLPQSQTPADALAVLWRVQAGFLDAALQTADEEHGSIDRYLQACLGLGPVERETLTRRYLQPA